MESSTQQTMENELQAQEKAEAQLEVMHQLMARTLPPPPPPHSPAVAYSAAASLCVAAAAEFATAAVVAPLYGAGVAATALLLAEQLHPQHPERGHAASIVVGVGHSTWAMMRLREARIAAEGRICRRGAAALASTVLGGLTCFYHLWFI